MHISTTTSESFAVQSVSEPPSVTINTYLRAFAGIRRCLKTGSANLMELPKSIGSELSRLQLTERDLLMRAITVSSGVLKKLVQNPPTHLPVFVTALSYQFGMVVGKGNYERCRNLDKVACLQEEILDYDNPENTCNSYDRDSFYRQFLTDNYRYGCIDRNQIVDQVNDCHELGWYSYFEPTLEMCIRRYFFDGDDIYSFENLCKHNEGDLVENIGCISPQGDIIFQFKPLSTEKPSLPSTDIQRGSLNVYATAIAVGAFIIVGVTGVIAGYLYCKRNHEQQDEHRVEGEMEVLCQPQITESSPQEVQQAGTASSNSGNTLKAHKSQVPDSYVASASPWVEMSSLANTVNNANQVHKINMIKNISNGKNKGILRQQAEMSREPDNQAEVSQQIPMEEVGYQVNPDNETAIKLFTKSSL